MNFRDDLITNKALYDTPVAFNRTSGLFVGSPFDSSPQPIGAIIEADGSILFRIFAPNATTVCIKIKLIPEWGPLDLESVKDGIFEGRMIWDQAICGPRAIDIIIDGNTVIDPRIPVYYGYGQIVNYVDIPDPDTDYILLRNVPHGTVSRQLFFSKAYDAWQACMIYTPPGYENRSETYPVLYLQHGAFENETTWIYNGKLPYILDNLLADQEIQPFIVVMNDGMARRPNEKIGDFRTFHRMLLEDCIPFIEAGWRVRTDKWNRAMAGLSMGSMQTSVLGLTHPDTFGWLGLFSGFMRASIASSMVSDTKVADPHLRLIHEDPEQFAREFRLFFRSMGDQDHAIDRFYEDDIICRDSGIDLMENYKRVVYPGIRHDWGAWRRALRDFAPLLFR